MRIAIITGGISTEREVALGSGANMQDWCISAGHECMLYDFPSGISRFLGSYQDYDLVIPVLHGIYGEDGQITAFLETLGCQYASSDFDVHSLCIDKHRTNLLIENQGISVPRSLYLAEGDHISQLENPLICYPVIVKPNRGGSSINTAKVNNREELITAQQSIVGDDILIQECIEGREFTVGIYRDTTGYHPLPIMEVITHDGVLFDYHEKYETDGSNEIFTKLEPALQQSLEQKSQYIAETLGCKGVVRVDWRYDGTDIYFLEINTIPGFRTGSFVPKMWKKSGKNEKEFVEMLVG